MAGSVLRYASENVWFGSEVSAEQGNQGGRRECGPGKMAWVDEVGWLHRRWAVGWWVKKVRVVDCVDSGCDDRSQMGQLCE